MLHPPQTYGRRQVRPLRTHRRYVMETLLPQVQLSLSQPFTKSSASYCLEIGFGGGEHLATLATQYPDLQFIGCEPFINGVASLLQHIERQQLANIKIFPGDARELLAWLPDKALSHIYLLFPDPWPKKRHHKRRFIQKENLEVFARVLESKGQLTIATDHSDYLTWIQEIFADQPWFQEEQQDRTSIYERPNNWITSRYEAKALAVGRKPGYFLFSKLT